MVCGLRFAAAFNAAGNPKHEALIATPRSRDIHLRTTYKECYEGLGSRVYGLQHIVMRLRLQLAASVAAEPLEEAYVLRYPLDYHQTWNVSIRECASVPMNMCAYIHQILIFYLVWRVWFWLPWEVLRSRVAVYEQ